MNDRIANLDVRMTDRGWDILCPPGRPIAGFLVLLSGSLIQHEWDGEQSLLVIPYNRDLDESIAEVIEMLTDLRYKTRMVQLELWGPQFYEGSTPETATTICQPAG